jgi:hypothetical protein
MKTQPTSDNAASGCYGLSLSELCGLLAVQPAAVIRWIKRGRTLRDGTRLHLRATLTPSGWRVHREDVDAFTAALTADRLGHAAPDVPPARQQARQSHERAERELAAAGFLVAQATNDDASRFRGRRRRKLKRPQSTQREARSVPQ